MTEPLQPLFCVCDLLSWQAIIAYLSIAAAFASATLSVLTTGTVMSASLASLERSVTRIFNRIDESDRQKASEESARRDDGTNSTKKHVEGDPL